MSRATPSSTDPKWLTVLRWRAALCTICKVVRTQGLKWFAFDSTPSDQSDLTEGKRHGRRLPIALRPLLIPSTPQLTFYLVDRAKQAFEAGRVVDWPCAAEADAEQAQLVSVSNPTATICRFVMPRQRLNLN